LDFEKVVGPVVVNVQQLWLVDESTPVVDLELKNVRALTAVFDPVACTIAAFVVVGTSEVVGMAAEPYALTQVAGSSAYY